MIIYKKQELQKNREEASEKRIKKQKINNFSVNKYNK